MPDKWNRPGEFPGPLPRQPFAVTLRTDGSHEQSDESPPGASKTDSQVDIEISTDDMDRLYRQALEAMEEVAADLSDACNVLSRPDSVEESHEIRTQLDDALAEQTVPSPAGSGEFRADLEETLSSARGVSEAPITPRQVIEAALFVGGTPLTTKKLCGLLRGDFPADFVEETIEAINETYAAEKRPYEIRLGEGGYRLALRSEYESVRNRVYGVGPREVRLSQEALEILSLIAYRQPISRTELESVGRDGAGNIVRQLLRRELVTIKRGENGRDDVRYTTTPRFLELFWLGRIDELPRADELEMK